MAPRRKSKRAKKGMYLLVASQFMLSYSTVPVISFWSLWRCRARCRYPFWLCGASLSPKANLHPDPAEPGLLAHPPAAASRNTHTIYPFSSLPQLPPHFGFRFFCLFFPFLIPLFLCRVHTGRFRTRRCPVKGALDGYLLIF